LAWYAIRGERGVESVAPPGVTLVNLSTGRKANALSDRAVRPPAATRPQDRGRQLFRLHGFSPSGDALFYNSAEELYAIPVGSPSDADPDPSPPRLVARQPDGFDSWDFQLSPDCRRVVSLASRYDQRAESRSARHVVRVSDESGRDVTLHDGEQYVRPRWLDGGRIILQDDFRVTLVNADGTGRRVIFESGSRN
jgi:hypothetical protein